MQFFAVEALKSFFFSALVENTVQNSKAVENRSQPCLAACAVELFCLSFLSVHSLFAHSELGRNGMKVEGAFSTYGCFDQFPISDFQLKELSIKRSNGLTPTDWDKGSIQYLILFLILGHYVLLHIHTVFYASGQIKF